jgi:hypothetical protein
MGPNWRRGLFRLWLVASILWVLGVLGLIMYEVNRDYELTVELFCFDPERPPREGVHECLKRMATHEGWELHRFEQSGPPTSPSELAKWELRRKELQEDIRRAIANYETPFWTRLRYNWFILPLGPILLFVIGGIIVKVFAWIGRGFAAN